MTDAVFDFPSINRKLNRQEQKAEYEANNPKEEQSAYGYLYGVPVPLMDQMGSSHAFRLTGAPSESESVTLTVAEVTSALMAIPTCSPAEYDASFKDPLGSLAHPEWPYAGTPFEWSKFVKVKVKI